MFEVLEQVKTKDMEKIIINEFQVAIIGIEHKSSRSGNQERDVIRMDTSPLISTFYLYIEDRMNEFKEKSTLGIKIQKQRMRCMSRRTNYTTNYTSIKQSRTRKVP